jgi:hypothetical protein
MPPCHARAGHLHGMRQHLAEEDRIVVEKTVKPAALWLRSFASAGTHIVRFRSIAASNAPTTHASRATPSYPAALALCESTPHADRAA